MLSFLFFLALSASLAAIFVFPALSAFCKTVFLVLWFLWYVRRILMVDLYAAGPAYVRYVIGWKWNILLGVGAVILFGWLAPAYLWWPYAVYLIYEHIQPWCAMLKTRWELYRRLPKGNPYRTFSGFFRFLFSVRPLTVQTAGGESICILGRPAPTEYRLETDGSLSFCRCVGIIPTLEEEKESSAVLLAARIMKGKKRTAPLPETEGTLHLLVHPYCALRVGDGDLLPGESSGRCTAIGKATFFAMMKE